MNHPAKTIQTLVCYRSPKHPKSTEPLFAFKEGEEHTCIELADGTFDIIDDEGLRQNFRDYGQMFTEKESA